MQAIKCVTPIKLMQYIHLASLYERLESTSKKLEKRDILAEFYSKCNDLDLYIVVLMSMGEVFPSGEQDLGVAGRLMQRIISKSCGIVEKDMMRKFKETGDLGLTAEQFILKKRQPSLASKDLTVQKVFDNLRKLPEISGTGSVERKIALVSELLVFAGPKEARYIVRTILGDMRIGVAAGIVRDAIAMAFEKDKKEVESAYDFTGDFGSVAQMARKGKFTAEMQLFTPVRVMLADHAKNLEEALEKFKDPLVDYYAPTRVEWKYDGFRIQCHKDGNKVKIFSRRLDDVTNQFPDIVLMVKENVTAKRCIIEGEAVAIDTKGSPLAFQSLSRRIQRKYEIEKMVKEIPVQVNLFDLIYFDGENWMDRPLKERWQKLKEIVVKNESFMLAQYIETENPKEAVIFYREAIEKGQEGVIVKNLDAKYQPGKRVGYWLKVKEILEPLDLVVTGAEWGEGKRAKWLGSLILAAKKGDEFVETGRMASGLTEQQMEDLTKEIKPLIISEEGKIVKIKPKIVLEIGYEEIQRSPKYPSGYALRFPRLLRIRDDKLPRDVNTVKEIEKLFGMQRGRKK